MIPAQSRTEPTLFRPVYSRNYLEPAHVEEELQEGEERKVHVTIASVLQKLSTHQTWHEEHVDGKSDNLLINNCTYNWIK